MEAEGLAALSGSALRGQALIANAIEVEQDNSDAAVMQQGVKWKEGGKAE